MENDGGDEWRRRPDVETKASGGGASGARASAIRASGKGGDGGKRGCGGSGSPFIGRRGGNAAGGGAAVAGPSAATGRQGPDMWDPAAAAAEGKEEAAGVFLRGRRKRRKAPAPRAQSARLRG